MDDAKRTVGSAKLAHEAIEHRLPVATDQAWEALLECRGAWADRDDIGSGAEYVERIRQPLEDRLRELGWG